MNLENLRPTAIFSYHALLRLEADRRDSLTYLASGLLASVSRTQTFRVTEEEHCFAAESGDSVRTPRNDPARPMNRDKDLLPAAREECLEALQRASEVVGEGVIKMVRGDRQKVCEICGEKFTASRRNAKICSVGCKQDAYRQRKKEVKQNR
jgi:hypothetical protein